MPPWVSQWVGIPYLELGRTGDGADCLGLYKMVFKDRHGVDIPDPFVSVKSAMRSGHHPPELAAVYEKVEDAQEGDAILLRHKGFPIHVGYCIDRRLMLHTSGKVGSLVEPWSGYKWINRVLGIYRYAG